MESVESKRPSTAYSSSSSSSRKSSASSTKSGSGTRPLDIDITSSYSILPPIKSSILKNKLEEELDLFVFYSTLPNHKSFSRKINEGTIFIKSFCDVFKEYAYKNIPNNFSLNQIITKINESVEKRGLQLAESINRLNKEVYFLPKDVKKIYFYSFLLLNPD